ncbi:MAG TPA: hypothetical protein VMT69_05490 [Kineosporiaceae bacterium]|nr:hypothetical protein [Kineosporiaceae bacterium]
MAGAPRPRRPRWGLLAPSAAALFSASVAWTTSHDPSAASSPGASSTGASGSVSVPAASAAQLRQALDSQTEALRSLSWTVRGLEARVRAAQERRFSPAVSGAASPAASGGTSRTPGPVSAAHVAAGSSASGAAPAAPLGATAAPVVRPAPSPAPPPPPVHTTTGASRP